VVGSWSSGKNPMRGVATGDLALGAIAEGPRLIPRLVQAGSRELARANSQEAEWLTSRPCLHAWTCRPSMIWRRAAPRLTNSVAPEAVALPSRAGNVEAARAYAICNDCLLRASRFLSTCAVSVAPRNPRTLSFGFPCSRNQLLNLRSDCISPACSIPHTRACFIGCRSQSYVFPAQTTVPHAPARYHVADRDLDHVAATQLATDCEVEQCALGAKQAGLVPGSPFMERRIKRRVPQRSSP